MRSLKSIFVALILAFFSSAFAQSIVLCESYDTDGKPSGIYSTWDISSAGSYVYILFSQTAPIREGTWYLYIDKQWDNNGVYSAFETIAIKPETGKKWFVHDQKFAEPGKYKAAVMRDGIEQASVYFEMNLKAGETPAGTSAGDETDTYYYEYSLVQFCKSVDDKGNPVGVSETFKLGPDGTAQVNVYLENNGSPFKTSKLLVDVYDDANKLVDNYTLDIDPQWDYVKFVHTFNQPGEYFVDIYNGSETFINTGAIKIEK